VFSYRDQIGWLVFRRLVSDSRPVTSQGTATPLSLAPAAAGLRESETVNRGSREWLTLTPLKAAAV